MISVIQNLFIIFNNNKVFYDLNDKTFLLNSSFLHFTNYNFKKIGIAEDGGVNIYAADISDQLFKKDEFRRNVLSVITLD